MPGSDNEFDDDDISSNDESSDEEEVVEEQEALEETLEDEALEDEALEDEALEDEALEDEALDDEALEDEGSDEGGSDEESDLNQKIQKVAGDAQFGGSKEDDDDEDEENNDAYLQKFNADINRQYLTDYHPEAMINNYQEINALTNVVRDNNNNIIDKLHRTLPYLTKYERARVLGQRAKQINSGAKAFVRVPENIIDGYLIAELELAQKRIPFIIRRPIPGGACEYWKLKDLEIIGF